MVEQALFLSDRIFQGCCFVIREKDRAPLHLAIRADGD